MNTPAVVPNRILIVDDDPISTQLTAIFAHNLGFEAEEYYSVQRLEERLKRLPDTSDVAALILDILMPERDGIECLCRLRLDNIAIPIIFVSAKSEYFPTVRLLCTALRQPGFATLPKPIDQQALSRALADCSQLTH